MRKTRFIAEGGGIYHLTSRILEKRFLLLDTEKERFRTTLWQVAGFCGVRVLAHCLMSNHVHLLVEVPPRPTVLTEEEIGRHLDCLPKRLSTGQGPGDRFRADLLRMRQFGVPDEELRAYCESYASRMFDLSRFGKELKQRYSQDYNTRHQRKGPLWEERFKSVLVENDSRILLRVAAYIDLNPLRAGLCGDPKDYRFCGYAGAVAGDPHCMQGMRRLCSLLRLDVDGGIADAFAAYRVALFGKARPDVGRTKGKGRAGLSPNAIDAVKRGKGLLGLKEVLGVRLRYMSEGIALGTAIFVEDQAKRFSILSGRKRMPRFERDPREDIAIWCFPRQMGTDPRGG